jgi:hypothetical protein
MAPGNNRLRSAKIMVSYSTVAIVPVIQDELTRLMIPSQYFCEKPCDGFIEYSITELNRLLSF